MIHAPLAIIEETVWIVHEIGRWREVSLRPKVSRIAGSLRNCRKGRKDEWFDIHLVRSLARAIGSDLDCNSGIRSVGGT